MTVRVLADVRGQHTAAARYPSHHRAAGVVPCQMFGWFILLASAVPATLVAQQPARACRIDVVEKTIPELQAAMTHGRATSVGLVEAYLARIAAYDRGGPKLNSVIRIDPSARAQATALDHERHTGHVRGALHGIPVLLKDNYGTVGMPTSAGSVALAGLVAAEDAFVVKKLRDAGAVILGKTNMHELAAGITTISSLGGQTLNPYDVARIPGGSSGGSAVAGAASFAALVYGSDTCGSLRIPAAFNDLFALRPTKGLTSVSGIVPLSHTQDVVGPLARTVTDLAIGLDAIAGADPADSATHILDGRETPRFLAALDTAALRGARLGVVRAWFGEQPEDLEAGRLIRAALHQMELQGAKLVDVSSPIADSIISRASLIDYEFKYDLMDYLKDARGTAVRSLSEILARGLYDVALDDAFRRRDSLGTRDSKAYHAALAGRVTVRNAILALLDAEHLDALAYPTARRAPPLVGEPVFGASCLPSAVSGLPALSAPAGFTTRGLPVGVELLGRPLADARLVALAYAYEHAERLRRTPPTTPPLVDGRPPTTATYVARARATGNAWARAIVLIDSARGAARYRIQISGLTARDVYATVLSRTTRDGKRTVVHRLSGPETISASGELTLRPDERMDLLAGRLSLILFSRENALGTMPATLVREWPRATQRNKAGALRIGAQCSADSIPSRAPPRAAHRATRSPPSR